MPDILQHDVTQLASRGGGHIGRITQVILGMVGLANLQLSLLGLVSVNLSVSDVLDRVRHWVQDRNRGDAIPARLSDETAISYVLNECYTQVKQFEQEFPDSRVRQPSADA